MGVANCFSSSTHIPRSGSVKSEFMIMRIMRRLSEFMVMRLSDYNYNCTLFSTRSRKKMKTQAGKIQLQLQEF
eukprot:3203594-Prorocentrum_lima.AAC.1